MPGFSVPASFSTTRLIGEKVGPRIPLNFDRLTKPASISEDIGETVSDWVSHLRKLPSTYRRAGEFGRYLYISYSETWIRARMVRVSSTSANSVPAVT